MCTVVWCVESTTKGEVKIPTLTYILWRPITTFS